MERRRLRSLVLTYPNGHDIPKRALEGGGLRAASLFIGTILLTPRLRAVLGWWRVPALTDRGLPVVSKPRA